MDQGLKTRRYAERFLNFRFIGIDYDKAPQNRPANWQQIEADFLKGLNSLEDECVDLMTSELALGHYGYQVNGKMKILRELYTRKVLKAAWKKLKVGGKVQIVVGDQLALKIVNNALKEVGFRNVKLDTINCKEAMKTPYMKKYFEEPGAYLSSGLIRISAVK